MPGLKTDLGKKVAINRIYTASPDYTVPSQFKVGVGTAAPTVIDTDLEQSIPIGNGTTNDAGDNQFTGSSGGDNSTDNTTTFKPGAGQTDDTSQNLIANDTATTKIWTISNLASAGTNASATQYTSLWIYIKDDTALAKMVSIEAKLGSDSSNYYSKTVLVADLATGWNFIDMGILNTNTETGTVSGNIDTFIIEAITNNATDEFAAGDLLYDLLRQYEESDLLKNYKSLVIDETNFLATATAELLSTEAVGYDISEIGSFNTDSTPKLDARDTYTPKSKSAEDEFKYTLVDGIQ